MLDAEPGVEQRMVGGGHVSGGVDVGVGGAQRLVDGDAAAVGPVDEREPGVLGEGGPGGGADRGEYGVRRVLLAVVGADGEDHAVLADDLGEPDAEVEADAVVAVQVGEELAELGAEDPVQRGGVGLDDGDLGAVAAGGGGDLQADPAAAA